MLAISEHPNQILESTPRTVSRPATPERREAERLARELSVNIKPLGFVEPIVGRTCDISEGGMFFLVPSSKAIAVGQRCELALFDEAAQKPIADIDSGGYFGTVIRTHPVTHGESQMLGAGVRFDQPIFLA